MFLVKVCPNSLGTTYAFDWTPNTATKILGKLAFASVLYLRNVLTRKVVRQEF